MLAGCVAQLAEMTGPEEPERSENAPPLKWISDEADWTTPRIHEGTIYTGGSFDVWALDAADGSIRWSYEVAPPSDYTHQHGKLDVVDGIVYAVGYEEVYALDEDGDVVWKFDKDESLFTAPVISGEDLFYGGDKLMKLDRTSGTYRWKRDIKGRTWETPALGDGNVFVASSNLAAFDDASGEKRFTLETEGNLSAPLFDDGVVFVGTTILLDDDNAMEEESWTGYFYAGDVQEERWLWRIETGRVQHDLPLAAHDDTVFVPNYWGTLYAVSMSNGTIKWSFETGSDSPSVPRVGDGVVYISSGDTLYAVDVETGQERWHATWDDQIFPVKDSPPLVTDDALYVGLDRMYAFDLS